MKPWAGFDGQGTPSTFFGSQPSVCRRLRKEKRRWLLADKAPAKFSSSFRLIEMVTKCDFYVWRRRHREKRRLTGSSLAAKGEAMLDLPDASEPESRNLIHFE